MTDHTIAPADARIIRHDQTREVVEGLLHDWGVHNPITAAERVLNTLRPADDALPAILAAIDNALRNGSYMTGGNLALDMLCDRLNVDRDRLVFRPDWAANVRDTDRG